MSVSPTTESTSREQPNGCGCQSHEHCPEHHRLAQVRSNSSALTGPCAVSLSSTAENPERTIHATQLFNAFDALARSSDARIARIEPFTITPSHLPWSQNLGRIRKKQQVSFFLSGQWWFLKEAGRWLEPGFVFFARVNRGDQASPIHNIMQNTGTLSADCSGMLEVARSAGEFASPAGDLWVTEEQYLSAQGQIQGIAIIWDEPANSGLHKLSAIGDVEGFLKAELQRQRLLDNKPRGWQNFFQFGDGSIFLDTPTGDIDCYTHKNVGILQYPVTGHPLRPGLTLNWTWLVDQLPSRYREDQLLNHDYLSIAVEFDDGQDITYMWSAQLPVGTVFRCPIPGWDQVETHVVQRSGIRQLGQELDEEVDLHSDYRRIVGGSARKVVKVWLIANSLFMRGHGRCAYRTIRIGQKGKQQQIV